MIVLVHPELKVLLEVICFFIEFIFKGGDSEVQRTMLELLNQLDGFEPTQNIKVIMATNRIDILDSALLRPGRIDRKIEFPAPNLSVRDRRENIDWFRRELTF